MSKFKLNRAEVHSALRLLIVDVSAYGDSNDKYLSSIFANHLSNVIRCGASIERVESFCAPKVRTRCGFRLNVSAELMALAILHQNFTLKVDCSALGLGGFLSISGDSNGVTAEFGGSEHSVPRDRMRRLSDAIELVGDRLYGHGV
jgi:hypothetical protein